MAKINNIEIDALIQYIQKVAGRLINSSTETVVNTGVIYEIGSGYYKIRLNQSNNEVNAIVLKEDNYSLNDNVYLIKATGGVEPIYYIFGKVDGVIEEYINLPISDRFEGEVEYNLKEINEVIDNSNLISNIKSSGIFKIQGTFSSNETEKNYGLVIELLNSAGKILSTYQLDTNYFIGQPFDMNSVVQERLIIIDDKQMLSALNKIQISFFNEDNKASVSDIKIIAGSLFEADPRFTVSVAATGGKKYFSDAINPLFNDETVELTATVYYNNKKIENTDLQYFWFIKDDFYIDSDFDFAGAGWKCLNSFSEITALAEDGTKATVRDWHKSNNSIELLKKVGDEEYFKSFRNRVKCIVRYQGMIFESELIDILNYQYLELSAEIVSSVSPANLISESDEIQLQCVVKHEENQVFERSDYRFAYAWYKRDVENSDILIGDSNILKIVDEEATVPAETEEPDTLPVPYEMTQNIEEYYCQVKVWRKDSKSEDPALCTLTTGLQAAQSFAGEGDNISKEEYYKYYVALNQSVSFQKSSNKDEFGISDWDIYDDNFEARPVWIDLSTVGKDGLEKIFNDLNLIGLDSNQTKEQFIYYTQQTRWIQNKGSVAEIIRKSNWIHPTIARSVLKKDGSLINYRDETEILQLNSFNSLTRNGLDKGIFYQDMPEEIEDGDPNPNIQYYQQVKDSSTGKITYEPIQLNITWGFVEEKEYYIKNEDGSYSLNSNPLNDKITYYKKENGGDGQESYTELKYNTQNFKAEETKWPDGIPGPYYKNIGNNLIINASYIRTGTLEVVDKFYASIDNSDVKIGGFIVDADTLQSQNGSVGFNSNDKSVENIAIWAGSKEEDDDRHPFEVDHSGAIYARRGEIGGFTVDTSTLSSKTGSVGFNSNDEFDGNIAIWAGLSEDEENSSHPFEVDHSGAIYARKGQIGGCHIEEDGSIASAEDKFRVDADGNLRAINASLTGYIRSENYSHNKVIQAWNEGFVYINISDGYTQDLLYSEPDANGNISVIGLSTDSNITDVIIPEYYNGYKINSIAAGAFQNNKNIYRVACLGTLETLGQNSFQGCSSIRYIFTNNNFFMEDYVTAGLMSSTEQSFNRPSITAQAIGTTQDADGFYYQSALTQPIFHTITTGSRYNYINNILLTNSYQVVDKKDNTNNGTGLIHYLYAKYENNQVVEYSSVTSITSTAPPDLQTLPISRFDIVVKSYSSDINFYTYSDKQISGSYWHYVEHLNGWQLSSDLNDNLLDSQNFVVTQEGLIKAKDAFIEGEIQATRGKLGKLHIEDGIKGYNSYEKQVYELTEEGLTINNDNNGFIQVGKVKLFSSAANTTYMQTNGPFCIQGIENGTAITSIELFTNDGTTTEKYSINLHVGTGTDQHQVSFKLFTTDSKQVIHDINLTIYYQDTSAVIFGTHSYENREIKSFPLSIPSGKYESETKTVKMENFFLGTFMRYGLSPTDWKKDIGLSSNMNENTFLKDENQIKKLASISILGSLLPKEKNSSYTLGNSDYKWNAVWAQTGTIQTSDQKEKYDIEFLHNKYETLFDNLHSVTYKLNEGTSNRDHVGFIAQDVKDSVLKAGLSTQNFAGYCEWQSDDGSIGCGLRYEEFIALCVDQIQKLKKKVNELEDKLNVSQSD